MHQSNPADCMPLRRLLYKIVAFLVCLLLELVGRFADLTLLTVVFRPVLLFAYMRLWVIDAVCSPYRWPRSFESVLRLKSSGQKRRELLYGEVMLVTAVFLFVKAGMRSGSWLVDLGAGRGRSLLAARFLCANARGIELLESHVVLTRRAMRSAGAVLEQGDAMKASLEGATHVFLNWCGFSDDSKARISERLRQCQPGTRIVAVTSPVVGDEFVVRSKSFGLFTWGVERVWIQERQ